MGRKPSYTADVADRARELAACGMFPPAIREKLLSEGHRVPSLRTIATITASTKGGKRGPVRGKRQQAKDKAAADAKRSEAGALVTTLEGAVATMKKVVAGVNLSEADADDVRLLNTTFRTLSHVAAQIQRMTPPPAPDPNEHPDMLAAADRGRGKLAEYVERVRSGK